MMLLRDRSGVTSDNNTVDMRKSNAVTFEGHRRKSNFACCGDFDKFDSSAIVE